MCGACFGLSVLQLLPVVLWAPCVGTREQAWVSCVQSMCSALCTISLEQQGPGTQELRTVLMFFQGSELSRSALSVQNSSPAELLLLRIFFVTWDVAGVARPLVSRSCLFNRMRTYMCFTAGESKIYSLPAISTLCPSLSPSSQSAWL